MAELSAKQQSEVDRLVAKGFSEKAAVEIATEIQLDQPVEHGSAPFETFTGEPARDADGRETRSGRLFRERMSELEADFARRERETRDQA